jgi:hypothetical protein
MAFNARGRIEVTNVSINIAKPSKFYKMALGKI